MRRTRPIRRPPRTPRENGGPRERAADTRTGGVDQRVMRVQNMTAPHSIPAVLRSNSTGIDDEP